MGLPVELRIAILEYVLAAEHIQLRHRQHDILLMSPPTKWNGAALLAVNTTIRQEAYPIFLENATFQFCAGFTERDLCRWIETVGSENISRLRTLEFRCVGRCSMYGLQPEYAYGQHSSMCKAYTRRSTDYCHRSATLIRDGSLHSAIQLRDVDMCSNRAFGCLEMGRAALDRFADDIKLPTLSGGDCLTSSRLLTLQKIMTNDQSSSAA